MTTILWYFGRGLALWCCLALGCCPAKLLASLVQMACYQPGQATCRARPNVYVCTSVVSPLPPLITVKCMTILWYFGRGFAFWCCLALGCCSVKLLARLVEMACYQPGQATWRARPNVYVCRSVVSPLLPLNHVKCMTILWYFWRGLALWCCLVLGWRGLIVSAPACYMASFHRATVMRKM